jgi:hypothetical protein
MAILFPVLSRVREAGRRAKCMGNLRQIQIAWQAYAIDHGDYVVNGQTSTFFDAAGVEKNTLLPGLHLNPGKPWLTDHESGDEYSNLGTALNRMRRGALAPYVGDVRAYLCPSRYLPRQAYTSVKRWSCSYGVVNSMNVCSPEDWVRWDRDFRAKYNVGRTVLYVRKTAELVDPGPAARAVFMDHAGMGCLWGAWFLTGEWNLRSDLNLVHDAPIHHSDGTCLSLGDGHVEYWRWSERETIVYGRWRRDDVVYHGAIGQPPEAKPDGPDYVRLFRATWGKWPSPVSGAGSKSQ